jgi:Cu(I)/Ag(I) efflux system membrane fusion protein
MRIKNVSVLGEEVEDRSGAMELYDDLERLVERVRTRFAPVPPDPELRRVQAPEEFRGQLAQVVRDYLDVQQALSSDDFERARQRLERLETDISKVNMNLLEGRAHDVWMKILSTLKDAASIMRQAEDLEGLRRCFALFSEAMIRIMEVFAPPLNQPVRLAHCPMAFDNRGASWLQRAEEIQNPYFGSMMFGCGEIRKSFGTEDTAAKGSGGHVH